VRVLKEKPEGYTLADWYDNLDPKNTIWSREEVTNCIRELVYQDLMTIELEGRDSEPVYRAS